jgi:hypothetical protein
MANRFFKLLYLFVLIAIGLSLPIVLLSSINFDEIVITTYKAKCLSNGKYVVLQGSPRNDLAYEFNELALDSIYGLPGAMGGKCTVRES